MTKIEVRCPGCDSDYLLDRESLSPGGGEIPCLSCGGMIPIDFSVPSRDPGETLTPAASPDATQPVLTRPVASGLSASDPSSEREEVICPRCHLHFRPRAEEASNALSARKTVLVVEDMKYFREIARDALGEKYDVRTVESPSEALDAIREGGIDLLVLDLTLDQSGGGVGLLAQLQPKPCPILIFTAEDESEMYGERWEELKKCGADDLVLKGMNVGDSLIKKVGELLGEPWDAEEISVQS